MSVHDTVSLSGGGDASEDQFGGVVTIWTHSTYLFSQRADSNGVILWETTGVPVCTTMNTNDYQKVVGDGLGGAIATWYGSPINGDNHIYAQRVYNNGTPGGITGQPIQSIEHRIGKIAIFPNPFSRQTTIDYQLSKPGLVSLKIFNITGQLVKTIYEGAKDIGTYHSLWKGRDNNGLNVASGLYFVYFSGNGLIETKKILKLKYGEKS